MKVRNTNASHSLRNLEVESQSDSNLLEISRNWTTEQWERYLQKAEGSLKEDLISEDHYDRIAESSEVSIFDYAQTTASPAIVERVQIAIEGLTTRQRQVVELIFFKLKSEREAALELGIDRSSIRKHKRKAIKNLRKIILVGAPTLPLVEGQKNQSEESNV